VNNEFTTFSGTGNPALARTITRELATQVGPYVVDIPGHVAVQLLDSVRARNKPLPRPSPTARLRHEHEARHH